MRTMFLKSPSPTRTTPTGSPLHHTFTESLMDENIEAAEICITKWDSLYGDEDASYCNIASLFSESNREEAKQYLNSVKGLQKAMSYLASHQSSSSDKLVKAQTLMLTAMKRLEKEFYQVLKSNRSYLDPESVSNHSSSRPSVSRSSFSDSEDDESENESTESIPEVERVSSAAMADLRAIAEAMISAGYAKECFKIYKTLRKSIVDEALHNLGVEKTLSLQQIQKMEWEALEVKIKNWLSAVKTAVKTLFYGERILCDQVFAISPAIRESCFTDIAKDGALALFVFPENVAKCRKTPEKMFRFLDLYEAVSDLWLEIESIFSFESTSIVRSTVLNSMIRLGDSVRTMLTDFEMAIQKDASKTTLPGGGIHPLTRYVMNYISFLADYSGVLSDIVADMPLPTQTPLPESYFGSPNKDESISSPISVRLAWLILVMLCKLDGKAEMYRDVALSYLFLANNLQYVVSKVRQSNLKLLLGDEWVTNHELKVKKYASNYERMGWSKVFASLPENPSAKISVDQVIDHFRNFNSAFEEAYKKQSSWIVPDPKLRDDMKRSLGRRIGRVYKEFYDNHGRVQLTKGVRYTPDDLGNYLSDLFFGSSSSGSVSSNSSRGGSSR